MPRVQNSGLKKSKTKAFFPSNSDAFSTPKHIRDGYSVLIYEGNPNNIDNEMAELKVNSFTVLGKGFIEIHTNTK